MGALASRRDDLAAVVDRLATTTGAIAREERALSDAIGQAPRFLRRANSTYVNVRSTLDVLDPFVAASKPVAPRLNALLTQLQPFAAQAGVPVKALADSVRKPGRANDLTELARATPRLRDITVRSAERNGRTRRGSFEEATESFRRSTPIWAFWRPYGPDVVGFLKAFGNVGIYDANGRASRSGTLPGQFTAGANGGPSSDVIRPWERQALIDRAGEAPQPLPGLDRAAGSRRLQPVAPVARFQLRPDSGGPGAMKRARRLLPVLALVAAVGFTLLATGALDDSGGVRYKLQLDNSYGLTEGSDVRVAGVRAGIVEKMRLDRERMLAEIEFELTERGFGDLRKDVTCETRPQSLIGEYFIDCDPGKSPREARRGRHDPGAARAPRSCRPTWWPTSCAGPTASASRSCSPSSARAWPAAART